MPVLFTTTVLYGTETEECSSPIYYGKSCYMAETLAYIQIQYLHCFYVCLLLVIEIIQHLLTLTNEWYSSAAEVWREFIHHRSLKRIHQPQKFEENSSATEVWRELISHRTLKRIPQPQNFEENSSASEVRKIHKLTVKPCPQNRYIISTNYSKSQVPSSLCMQYEMDEMKDE